jgi:vitamin B12/bleomycin/antimicrobial peptide transport system ATP-binding/permease protein
MLVKLGFLRDAWRLTWPYWRSEEKWSAAGLLAAVVALTLFAVWLSVQFNHWYNNAYNALQAYDAKEFWWQARVFGLLAAAYIVAAVYRQYLHQMLEIRWRRWMTARFLKGWLDNRAYYRMQLDRAATDNPDQRIADDIKLFTEYGLSLSLGLLDSIVTLFSFLFILWTLSGILTIPLGRDAHIDIPGYLVIAAFCYAAAGTWLTHWVGRPLVRLLFDAQRYEADFRFSLVRLRENAESVALYGGEDRELGVFRSRFTLIVANWLGIIRRRKKLQWLTSTYTQLAIIFPFFVAAPRYFAKEIQLGGLMQITSAFGKVQDALSFIVSSYTSIADYQAVVQRLSGFHGRVTAIADAGHEEQPIAIDRRGVGIEVGSLDLDLPSGTLLQRDVALKAGANAPVLITGPTGSGKSTLLRAIAGLWPFGRGHIRLAEGSVLFLPQRPYLPLGTLADALDYPGTDTPPSREAMATALRTVGLPDLVDQLDVDGNWAQRLSGGEQQRLGFARILLERPGVVFLDEATSALDEATELVLYHMLRDADWHPTIVSVGHHRSLKQFHEAMVDLTPKMTAAAK